MKSDRLKFCIAAILCLVAGFIGAGVTFGLSTQLRTPYEVITDFQGLVAALVALSGAVLALIAAQSKVKSEENLEQRRKDALAHSVRAQARGLTFQAFGIGRRLSATASDVAKNLASVHGYVKITEDWSRKADELTSYYRNHCHELRPADIDEISNLMVRFDGLVFDVKTASMVIGMFPQTQPSERLERGVKFIGMFIQMNVRNVAAEYSGAIEEWTKHFQEVDDFRDSARKGFEL